MTKTKRIVLIGLFIALSVIGASFEIPSPTGGTLSFDSMPGYLAGLLVGGLEGGIIALLGHLIIAAKKGFYLTVPVHIIVAFMMFISVYCYNYISKKLNVYLGIVVAIIINGVLAPLALVLLPGMGMAFFIGVTPVLVVASTVNIIFSYILYKSLKNVIKID